MNDFAAGVNRYQLWLLICLVGVCEHRQNGLSIDGVDFVKISIILQINCNDGSFDIAGVDDMIFVAVGDAGYSWLNSSPPQGCELRISFTNYHFISFALDEIANFVVIEVSSRKYQLAGRVWKFLLAVIN